MATCVVCDKVENLRLCGRCGVVSYCGREHQKQHWKVHKKVCAKPAAESSSSEGATIQPRGPENGSCGSTTTQINKKLNEVTSDIRDMNLGTENRVAQNSIPLNPLSEYTESDESIVKLCCKNLTQWGICVIDNFTGENPASLCLADATALYSRPDQFKPGQVIKPGSREKIRGDEIIWLDGTREDSSNINYVCRKMDMIISKCRSTIENYKISQRTKAMLACYPGNGTAYKCHIDNPTGDGRCITAIYYMNKGWDKEKMGGMLRIYPKSGKVAHVEPKFNRLLLFFSDSRNPHEVLPAFATRFAVTIWYFDDEERQKAIETWKKNRK